MSTLAAAVKAICIVDRRQPHIGGPPVCVRSSPMGPILLGAIQYTDGLVVTQIFVDGSLIMEVKRILWPTDLSGRAKHALDYVRSLTERYNAEIHVLYVITDIAHHRGLYGNFEQAHIDRIYAWEEKKAAERLEQICSQELEGCPLYVKHVAVGDPAQEIINTVVREDIDMVVLATRGTGGHFQVGAVADKVVKHSPVPVAMVPSSGEPVEMEMVS